MNYINLYIQHLGNHIDFMKILEDMHTRLSKYAPNTNIVHELLTNAPDLPKAFLQLVKDISITPPNEGIIYAHRNQL